MPKVFVSSDAIYVFRASEFILRSGFPSKGRIPFLMNAEDRIDIETEDDIFFAEILLRDK